MADKDDTAQPIKAGDMSYIALVDKHALKQTAQHVILFYKYHPLAPEIDTTERYRCCLEDLCRALSLSGRILVGASRSEGINGTLAGNYADVRAFTYALLGDRVKLGDDDKDCSPAIVQAVRTFWTQSKEFFDGIGEQELRMDSPDDFKWSCSTQIEPLFPDLNIKIVREVIGTGGVLSSIPLDETAKGYLTPKEWHDELAGLSESNEDTILIDCRNQKEYTIGRFTGATDPQTTTFAQFPKWVDDHSQLLAYKKVLMYCTGGIRCEKVRIRTLEQESLGPRLCWTDSSTHLLLSFCPYRKASAYIRRQVPSAKDVKHLKGGIHKYLEEYGSDDGGIWKGRNFVFDGRGAASADETKLGKDGSEDVATTTTVEPSVSHDIVGMCISCNKPYDSFDPRCVCTVCREPTLTCGECQERLVEFHCQQHYHLRSCYFSNLERFSANDLDRQLDGISSLLEEIAVGRRFRQKRKTLQKQSKRIKERLVEIEDSPMSHDLTRVTTTKCRNCGDLECLGRCWGFYGLKRKELLEQPKELNAASHAKELQTEILPLRSDLPKVSKKPRRDRFVDESEQLLLSQPSSAFRDAATGIRVPPPCTRVLQTAVKAKWCGRNVLSVIQKEFVDLARPEVIRQVLRNGLLRVNAEKLSIASASDLQLKMSDTISRVVHWHEPPVLVPNEIGVEKIPLPPSVIQEFGGSNDGSDVLVYVCNKPSSVPVHPAGPYLANSLTVMVEAQEKLHSRSLNPIHRTDRVTSGLTICCTSQIVSRIFHRCLMEGEVHKLYIAKVHGRFPSSQDEFNAGISAVSDMGERQWCNGYVEIVAPVETLDPANGVRAVSAEGKPSKSLFKPFKYNADDNTSLILCVPVTGRNHQLRVHLQWIGFPIINDAQYGGQLDANRSEQQSDAGLNWLAASIAGSDVEKKLASISNSDVLSAKQACQCCTGGRHGIQKAFSPAQLLKGGHAIMLHALSYRVTIRPKKRPKDETKADPLAVMHFKVDPPEWADPEITDDMSWFAANA